MVRPVHDLGRDRLLAGSSRCPEGAQLLRLLPVQSRVLPRLADHGIRRPRPSGQSPCLNAHRAFLKPPTIDINPPEREPVMTETSLDELGPVDYLIVEFPAGASNFTGEMATELLALSDAGTIRVIDLLILVKEDDGSVDAVELADLEDLGDLQVLEAQLAELLAEEDVVHLAAAMDPASTAGVIIYENVWAAPFASAARRAGGQLIANGRIPIQAILAAVEADEALETAGG